MENNQEPLLINNLTHTLKDEINILKSLKNKIKNKRNRKDSFSSDKFCDIQRPVRDRENYNSESYETNKNIYSSFNGNNNDREDLDNSHVSNLSKMCQMSEIVNRSPAQFSELEKSLKYNEAKINDIQKNIENILRSGKFSNSVNLNNKKCISKNNSMNTLENKNFEFSNLNINSSNYKYQNNEVSESIDREKLIQENITLKSDCMIYREDINYLTEINKNLEMEMEHIRKKNINLVSENEHLNKEILQKTLEVEKMAEAISKLRLYDNPELEFAIDSRHMKDVKIKQLELDIKSLKDEKMKLEIDSKVTLERYLDLKEKYKETLNDISLLKSHDSQEINCLELKIENLIKQLDFISKENKDMRLTDEKCRHELNNLKKSKEKYEEKYHKLKEEKIYHIKRISDLENELKIITLQKNVEFSDIRKDEEIKKNRIQQKNKIFEEMQIKILSYKKDLELQRKK